MLRLQGISFAYGHQPTLTDITLQASAGEFVALLGPSGCGQTTLLRLITGDLSPSAGQIVVNGAEVTTWPPERRGIGMVFQNYALFPHLSARANVAFGLEVRGLPRQEWQRRVDDMLDRVGLDQAVRERRPAALSGGQQQRVALARALVIEPRLLLLDEPFANLDRHLREILRDELRDLQKRTGVTTILVTHDQEDAMSLADRVGIMSAGRLLQIGPPRVLYERPQTPFVARYLGDANLLPGERMGRPGELLLLRPEQCVLGEAAEHCPVVWTGCVVATSFLGADVVATVSIDPEMSLQVRCRAASDISLSPGQSVRLGIPLDVLWSLPEHGPGSELGNKP
jgi:ABC-type Fe3+/spermidine/putrescine transport system ATPase subunit